MIMNDKIQIPHSKYYISKNDYYTIFRMKQTDKMRKLQLFLEYGCYPVWSYDEDGDLLWDDFPDENPPSKYLDELKVIIAEEYMATFINNSHEFCYKGFYSKEECQEFVDKLNEFRDLVKKEYQKTPNH